MSSPSDKYKLDKNNFKLGVHIKQGGFNCVYSIQDLVKNQKYAAKVLQTSKYEDRTISQEIKIRTKVQHPTINKFIGYIQYPKYTCLIMEIPSQLSLHDIFNQSTKITSYDNTARQIILIGLSYAMMLLHKRHICHFSLTPESVLLDQHFYPQITDFEFENPQSRNYPIPIYSAPEFFKNQMFNNTSDVYSFSLIMYQIITGQEPFPLISRMTEIQFKSELLNKMLRPQIPPSMKKSFSSLLERCWSSDPNKRPKFDEIYQKVAYDSEFYLSEINHSKIFKYILNVLEDPQAKSPISSPIRSIIANKSKENEILKNTKISEFNSFPLQKQRSIMEVIIKSAPDNSKFGNLFNLLNYFSTKLKAKNELKFIEIITDELDSKLIDLIELNQIHLLFNSTLLLFQKKAFNLDDLLNMLNQFDYILIELQYPYSMYDQIYTQICEIIDRSLGKLKIKLTISVPEIENDLFKDNKYLGSVVLDSSVISIGVYSFGSCISLRQIKIGDSVTGIHKNAFDTCTSLKEIIIPDSVQFINRFAFNKCYSLEKVVLPSNLTCISKALFYGCRSLKTIKIPNSVNKIDDIAFLKCTSLKLIEIPNSVKSIGDKAFAHCKSLVEINIPGSVTSHGDNVFLDCPNLINKPFDDDDDETITNRRTRPIIRQERPVIRSTRTRHVDDGDTYKPNKKRFPKKDSSDSDDFSF